MTKLNSFFLAACSDTPAGGIYQFQSSEQGLPRQVGFTHISKANWLCLSPNGQTLYSTCNDEKGGGVAAFRVGEDGPLTLLNQLPSSGRENCYVTLAPDGHFVYCANYATGNLAEFSLNADGSFNQMTQLITHEGHGPFPKRQECAHVHYTNFTPDNHYLLAIDLGIDALKIYPFTPGKGIAPAKVKTVPVIPAGAGPRHMVFTRSGNRAYLVNELSNTVMYFQYNEGDFTHIQTISTLPRDVNEATKAAAIRLSPDERFLLVSNRGFDSIATFSLAEDGTMQLADLQLTGGSSPRDIQFLPNGKSLAVCNEFSDTVFFFDYDAKSGKLMPNGGKLEGLPRPLAICGK